MNPVRREAIPLDAVPNVARAQERRLDRVAPFMAWADQQDLRERLQIPHRSAESIAEDEATLVALEQRYELQIRRRELEQRRSHVRALQLPITEADEAALVTRGLQQTRVLMLARTWWDDANAKPLLVLSGPPGRGKTIAACSLLADSSGAYVRALEWTRLFLAPFGDEVERREALIATAHVLVVDDIGVERNPEAMTLGLTEALDARRRGQRTIWITNLPRGDFEARYSDARLLSRMAQSAAWLVDKGDDMRGGR